MKYLFIVGKEQLFGHNVRALNVVEITLSGGIRGDIITIIITNYSGQTLFSSSSFTTSDTYRPLAVNKMKTNLPDFLFLVGRRGFCDTIDYDDYYAWSV